MEIRTVTLYAQGRAYELDTEVAHPGSRTSLKASFQAGHPPLRQVDIYANVNHELVVNDMLATGYSERLGFYEE